jgi:hypothetical protein
VVFNETFRVLGHTEFFEPIRNLLHRGHRGPVVAEFLATAVKELIKNIPAMARLAAQQRSQSSRPNEGFKGLKSLFAQPES